MLQGMLHYEGSCVFGLSETKWTTEADTEVPALQVTNAPSVLGDY